MTMKIKQTFNSHAHGINNMSVTSYDTGEAFSAAVLQRYEVNGFVEHTVYSNEFAPLLQTLIDDGMKPSEHLQVIAAANNLIYFRVMAELDEESRKEIVESSKAHWRDERKRLREIEKEKREADEQKQLKALSDLGIDRSTLRKIVDGKLDIPAKETGGMYPQARKIEQVR